MSFSPQYQPTDSEELRQLIATAQVAWEKILDEKATKIDLIERIRRFQLVYKGNMIFIQETNALVMTILSKPKQELFKMNQCEEPKCLRDLRMWVNEEFYKRLDKCDLIAFEAILRKHHYIV